MTKRLEAVGYVYIDSIKYSLVVKQPFLAASYVHSI